ncbi:MAG: glutamine synthetase [Woeseiaceae bacterium]
MGDKFKRVRVLFADQLNLARGKYLPASFASKGSARLCVGTYAVTYSRDLIDAPGACVASGLPDIEAVFDPDSLRPGWEKNTKIAMAELEFEDEPSGLCGRKALRKARDQWRELGFDPMIGIEGEAFVFQRADEGGWEPYDTPGAFVYGTGPFIDPAGLIEEIWAMAYKCDMPIESINAEYDTPQFELTLEYGPALNACDDFFLFRTMARELAYKRGYLLSFMPKPLPDFAGSGMHINLSFRDKEGNNAMAGGTHKGKLSKLVSGCIAGLVHHHESMGALVAPTVNSYDRLKPASLCGFWANWGHDHRGVAVRVSSEEGPAARIEHRVADCAASPYVVTAAVLQAARLGFINGYELPPEETGDGLETVNTDRSIAENLGDALDRLVKDEALVEAVGPLLIENFVAIKRAEIEEVKGMSPEEVFDYYGPFL